MALEVRTANGKKFNRAGIAFGKEPVVVPDKDLEKKLGPPSYPKGSTVGSVLENEPALICRPVKDKAAGNGQK
jgi:hypothetical protein